MTMYTEGLHTAEFLLDDEDTYSREQVTIDASAADMSPGTVLGKITVGSTAAAAALGTNTGNGTFGAIAVSAGAAAGDYSVVFQDATHYVVEDPSGRVVGHGTAGAAFAAGGVGFTITAGGTAFVPGDAFKVTVAAGSGKYVAYNPANADGSQKAAGILYAHAPDLAVDQKATAVVRQAEVASYALVGLDAAARVALAAIGIIVRD